MESKIVIEPVTRVEGHGKVSILLDESGNVKEARLHVTQLRGFEKFCEGRLLWEMPVITPRICGICPVSHQLASVKAADVILGVELPPTALKLRRLLHMAQLVQSHALHFFYLASPDFLLGMDADPAKRNIMGLIAEMPEVAARGVGLRAFGQRIIAELGEKRIHPQAAVPGGMCKALSHLKRDEIQGRVGEVIDDCRFALELFRDYAAKSVDRVEDFSDFPSAYLGMVDDKGNVEYYDGKLRFKDSEGAILKDGFPPRDYLSMIAEAVQDWSYLKFPYYKELGRQDGMYRVGPLARLNVADRCSTPLANDAFRDFKDVNGGGAAPGSLKHHHARLIELLNCAEEVKLLIEDPSICGTDIRVEAHKIINDEGVGAIEAPRGTLFHHYRVDGSGVIRQVNLIVATGHNNLAMNRAVTETARRFIKDGKVSEGILNRVEAAIRCYDPCLSCATHALGQMPLEIAVFEPDGKIRDVLRS